MYILKTLIAHDLKEHLKSKFMQAVFIFAVVIIYASLLFSALSPEQEPRVLANFGLAATELVGVIAVLFGLSSAVIKDIESKTIYLILSRPVKRWQYITAKYIGLVLSVWVMVFLMGLVLETVLLIKGGGIDLSILRILVSTCLKISVLGALALLFSLISTSVLSAIIISGIFYTLGHFIAEIKFITKKLAITAKILTLPLKYIIPNMAIFNLNDILNADNGNFAGWNVLIGYTLVYSAVCVVIGVFLFKKREF